MPIATRRFPEVGNAAPRALHFNKPDCDKIIITYPKVIIIRHHDFGIPRPNANKGPDR